MPRGKSFRRSEAARRREAEREKVTVEPKWPNRDFVPRRGTGTRHRVRKWPVSVTGRQHKLVIPAESPDKKFVLIVGASHLRSIADGIVPMPEGMLSFGVMSTPGACASDLRTELRNAVVPRTPDAVCIMAPSNNLTASRTPLEAGADFQKLLYSARSRWPNVFVLDFVPRLTVDPQLQEFMRQEFHRVAARMGIKYFSSSGHFPLNNLDLWSPDGVHLSDGEGMVVLTRLLWAAAYESLEVPVPKPQAAPKTSLPVRHVTPRVVVRGEVIVPRPSNPYEWTSVERGRKFVATPVVLKECFIPLNPVRFSSSMLAVMDAVVPSHLPTPECTAVPHDKTKPVVERRRKAVACKRRPAKRQVEATPSVVEVCPRPTPASPVKVVAAAEAQVTPCVVDTSPEPSPATAVEVVAAAQEEEAPVTPGVVDAFPDPSPATADEEEVSTPRSVKDEYDANPISCRCLENEPIAPVVSGKLTAAPLTQDVNVSIAGSVVAAIKHAIAPVCTWRGKDIDDICAEGSKLASLVAEGSQDSVEIKLCKLIEQGSVFGRKWKVDVTSPVYGDFGFLDDDSVMYEQLQETLLSDGMCLLNLQGSVSAIIHHNKYFVVVDSGTRDASGLASSFGRPVAVFNTSVRDLMYHIRDLKRSLGAEWYAISSVSLTAGSVDPDMDSATLLTDVDVDVTVATAAVVEGGSSQSNASSVRGSFHQADTRFQHAGVQCMAISLVAVAKHSIDSVFSWQTNNLDKVVVLGNKLYNTLRDSNVTSEVSELLSVPDLPRHSVIDGQTFDFEYGDCVSGYVDVVTGDLIDAGVITSLRSGLDKMFSKYHTCFLTLGGNTCAIIGEGGRFAVVDSHARSADGMVDVEGKSVVVYFTCLDDVFGHICKFATSFKPPKQFEIAGVCVIPRCPVPPSSTLSGPKVVVERRASQSGCSLPVQPTVGCTSIKRKTSSSVSSSKKSKNSDFAAVNSDVVFVADVVSKGLQFNPLCGEVVDTLCKQLNVDSEKVDLVSTEVGPLGAPCLKEKIVSDGNCFFRAVSQAVCGTQKYHRKIRLAVVKHLRANGGILRTEYSSMEEYLSVSKMAYVGSWATEVEIQAAADFLGVGIFTYCDNRWLEYSCKYRPLSNQGIYLENCNGNHYETVVCVQQPSVQSCYGYCKVGGSRYNFRERSVCADTLTSVALSSCDAEVEIIQQNVMEQQCSTLSVKAQSPNSLNVKSPSKYFVRKKKLQKQIKYQENRQKFLEKMKMNYQAKSWYKEKLKEMSKTKYQTSLSHRDRVKKFSKTKYQKNLSHRDRVKTFSKTKYQKNCSHRDRVKTFSKTKYQKNRSHRDRVKTFSKTKYQKNRSHRDRVKTFSKTKYQKNRSHRDRVKTFSKTKYKINLSHRDRVKKWSRKKYRNRQHRQRVIARMKLRRQRIKATLKEFDLVMKQFLGKVNDGPEFVCCVCFRGLFCHQVLPCRRKDYSRRKEIGLIADRCISEEYLHKCNPDCVLPCQWLDTARGQLWICLSCHNKISRGIMPPESALNNLATCCIPPELACLNTLEQHLIALHIPFMKLLALPKGGQNGIHGPVTCVPANIVQTSNLLPRSDMDGSLLPVKLKRKLTYKGHYEYQFVDSMRIKQALQYLKRTNVHYKDVDFNEAWLNEFCREQERVWHNRIVQQ
uniref:ubiquitinyl hydrolase 1 n=1 Tax=Dicentrarchus labrax TaxID=13489 RepID=A0A8P4FZU0_DICLA